MGRHSVDIDMDVLMDCFEQDMSLKDTAEVIGCSAPTVAKKIRQLQRDNDVLLQYQSLESLHITELKHLLLNNITEQKIQEASLGEIASAYAKLSKADLEKTGGDDVKEVKGLVEHLVFLEKQRLAQEKPAAVLTDMVYDEEEETHKMPLF